MIPGILVWHIGILSVSIKNIQYGILVYTKYFNSLTSSDRYVGPTMGLQTCRGKDDLEGST